MNYDSELKNMLKNLKEPKTLLLHSCCAPCSSYVLEFLSNYFNITVFYYNPNITDEEEYNKRVEEQIRLIKLIPTKNKINFIKGTYEPDKFFELSKGLTDEKEGGARCVKCYYMRLEETAKMAKEKGFDFFTTTLTVSPYKKSDKLNDIGKILSEKYKIDYLFSDFKKSNGYKRSIELSKKYNLYRQNYCGCIYSKKEDEIYE